MKKPTLNSIIYNGVLAAVKASPKFTPEFYAECARAMESAASSSMMELVYRADSILNKL